MPYRNWQILYTNYGEGNQKAEEHIIKTNVNFDRMEVNKPYRENVFKKYFNNAWINKCSKEADGYIGNPEEEYRNQKFERDHGDT